TPFRVLSLGAGGARLGTTFQVRPVQCIAAFSIRFLAVLRSPTANAFLAESASTAPSTSPWPCPGCGVVTRLQTLPFQRSATLRNGRGTALSKKPTAQAVEPELADTPSRMFIKLGPLTFGLGTSFHLVPFQRAIIVSLPWA